jgi:hypothetical protein
MQGNKTLQLAGLIVLIIVAVGFIIYQMRGGPRAAIDQSRQEAIKAQNSTPGFTPAPR